jgi:hypothetical protein
MALGRSPPRRLPRWQAHLHGTGLNHCPSGVFNANTAWLLAATLAHNLIRWTQLLALIRCASSPSWQLARCHALAAVAGSLRGGGPVNAPWGVVATGVVSVLDGRPQ